jgi:hypothetical protein
VQWQVSTDGGATFNNIGGATSLPLSFTATTAQNGHRFRAVFSNTCGTATTTAATLTVNTAPGVTTDPVNQTVCAGSTATFTAAASGSPSPTVQWQVSTDGGSTFNDVPGATSTTLSFTAAGSQNGHRFRAVFTNSCNTATTTAAILTVNTATAVTTNPTDQTVCDGTTASFTAAASGSPTPTVQWQVSTDGGATFNNIGGATSLTLSFTATTAQNGHRFRAVFSNSCGDPVNTTSALLTVNTAPSVTTDPGNQTVCAGSTATFAAAASGSPSPTVQWQVSTNGGTSFSNIGGATSATLSFTSTAGQNGHRFRAVFTNTCGTATSAAAILTVNTAPVVTGNPANVTVCAGTVVNFSAGATGSPVPGVQWQVSTDGGATFGDIPGATSSILSFAAAAGQNGHRFRAVFANTCGTASTTAAILTVNTAPVITVNPTDQIAVGGGPVTFTAAAVGSPAPTVQWQVSTNGGATFNNIPGATSPSYTFTPTPAQFGNRYRAVFTNVCGTAITANTATGAGAGLQVYDIWLQDDSQSLTVLMANTVTGNYVYCCQAGVTVVGVGKVTKKGCYITLDHTQGPDFRVLAKVDKCLAKGEATIQVGPGQTACHGIIDRNIYNNTNVCSTGGQ